MLDFNKLLQKLYNNPKITKPSLGQVPKKPGVYVLWLNDNPPLCLKVGKAGERQGKGLQERLQLHFSSNPENTVLARHMEADMGFGQERGYDFCDRFQRQQFLANKCFFQVLPLSDISKEELLQVENFLELKLNPKYKGKVKKS